MFHINIIQNENTHFLVCCEKYEINTWQTGAKELTIYDRVSSNAGVSYTIANGHQGGEMNAHGNPISCRAIAYLGDKVVEDVYPDE